MPTFEVQDRFRNEYQQLRRDEREAFRQALKEFVQVLREWERAGARGIPHFPAKLGVRHMMHRRGILEFAWAPDGRCTWEYGTPRRSGKYHIIWRRIGSHAIYDDP